MPYGTIEPNIFMMTESPQILTYINVVVGVCICELKRVSFDEETIVSEGWNGVFKVEDCVF